MATKLKIKIKDNEQLRMAIDELYEKTSQEDLAKWSLKMAKRILDMVEIDYLMVDEIVDGFRVNELWQEGQARMHDVRQAGFKIHKLAREMDDVTRKTALRVVGQAVASGHMREHAMVASDYAIKTINLLRVYDLGAVKEERLWQLNELKKIHNE